MAELHMPLIVRRVAQVFATTDDNSTVDTVISVGATVFVAQFLAGLTASVIAALPLVGTLSSVLALPVTAGVITVVANYLATEDE